MYTYDKLFSEYNHTVAQILLTGYDVHNEISYNNFCNTMFRLLELGALPVINENDTISTEEIGIGDNDTLAAIVAIIVAICLIFPSPKMLAKRYVNALIKENASQAYSCLPSYIFEDNDDKKDAIEELEDRLEDLELDEYDSIKVEVKEVNKLSKSERERLENIIEAAEENRDNVKAKSFSVSSARMVEVKVTVKDGGDTYRAEIELMVVKYKGVYKIVNTEPITTLLALLYQFD
jgi:hypothetical protein